MKENLALILGILFLIDAFAFAFANIGKPIEWKYWFMPKFTIDGGMMMAFIAFYGAIAGFLIAYYVLTVL